ncbi:MAG: D-alanine--D-alanine ligase [FCB group bacterium]|nr:D-alanine--D-alanine ligase [FCB group bacterium]
MTEKKLNILILAGGDSPEREVSLTSAEAVAEALIGAGHNVFVIDPRDGRWLGDEGGLPFIRQEAGDLKTVANHALFCRELKKVCSKGIDVVFNALHGGSGENGRVQAMLDIHGLPYTGSPMAASAVAMNKDWSKRIMRTLKIPTADWLNFNRTDPLTPTEMAAKIENQLSLPVIIKPTDGGSTVGLSLVEKASAITEALEVAFAVADSVLAEKYFEGREITISVLDGKPLPPVEIKPSHKLYDYTCKYTKGKSEYICPADIELDFVEKLADDAVRLYHTIGCRGYARIDFIVGSDGSYICLELNTLPGMTALSLFPMAAKAVGIEFDQLLVKLCQLALEGE